MRRAIRLAMNGRGFVEPNPMVGCVIVKDGRVIGEGYHQKYGGPHAEPNALASCTEDPRGATAYVTLEPCCHTNKKTPPCTPLLIGAGIKRVVIGAVDPNPPVNGRGWSQLRSASIEVASSALQDQARQLIAPFCAHLRERRPYVTLKWAETADGKVAGPLGSRLEITNERSTHLVHQLRSRCDAIMIGINTVLTDDPMLTPRGVEHLRPVERHVLDRNLRIPLDCKLVQSASEIPLKVECPIETIKNRRDKVLELTQRGVLVQPAGTLRDSLSHLHTGYAMHLLVEPGPTLARSFLEENLVDRVWVFRSPKSIGVENAPTAVPLPDYFARTGELGLDGDILIEHLNTTSRVFYALEPSADFVLAADVARVSNP